jgi:tetratricopeptide (TPR) repeat protein
VERARSEGRYQQALDLTKQLYKYEPTPAHQQLLKEVYLGRARQLANQGYIRDAATVLEVAVRIDEKNPAWVNLLASELGKLGEGQRAMNLLRQSSGAGAVTLNPELQGQMVDAALVKESAGRNLLPPDLQPEFDCILRAFAQVEAGQDEEAKTTLQGIGLRSPFLEWKLLLRGLQAYYQKDDARALENWQRLSPQRTPSRLAAPFRFQLDPAYQAAQPPATQTILMQQADRLQSNYLLSQLRGIRTRLTQGESLAPVFRQVEALLPALRLEAPQLVSRLAVCFYWAVIETGPDDILRYQRVFGKPPDDPNFSRLRALAHDHGGDLKEAHRYWQLYEKEIAANPDLWPKDQAQRARALIWKHMGDNAERIPPPEAFDLLPPMLRDLPDVPRPLSPDAGTCYLKSLELAPDQIEAHEALFHSYLHARKPAEAEQAARNLLSRFPNHVDTLEELATLLRERGEHAESLNLLQEALKHNPLVRRLREKVATAHLLNARVHVEAAAFDQARQHYQSALQFANSRDVPSALCRWAACEFKAGNAPRAEELIQQSLAQGGAALPVAFYMLTETLRLKLPAKLKKRFDQEFTEGLQSQASAAAVTALAGYTASLQATGVNYRGLKTHIKKVLGYVDKARSAEFTEEQLIDLCRALLALEAMRVLHSFLALGRHRFPACPEFPYIEALTHFRKGPQATRPHLVTPLLDRADKLARALPPDDRRDSLLRDIEMHKKAIAALNPFGNLFEGFMQQMSGMFDDDDWDDDYDDDDDDWYGRRRRR